MATLQEAAEEFLAQRRIAVVGVSRSSQEAANLVYRTLRDTGYQVFPVNPNTAEVEGDRCFPTLAAIPDAVDGVVIATPPEATRSVVEECVELGIVRVWMHRSFGPGSVDHDAVERCRRSGISVIPGACPMMFRSGADLGHRCMRWVLGLTGGLPKVPGGAGEGDSEG